ncbi:MAG: Crp/Fnr family transcriptional regulator, partial [Metallibacterium sp.]
MGQTAVCNRHHSLDQKLCRWLLLSLDRLQSSNLVMTQELIANMLGVRREGVTEAQAQGRKRCAAFLQPKQHGSDSDAAHEQQNDHDDQDDAQATAGSIAPASAVWPTRNRAEQKYNQDNQQYHAKHRVSPCATGGDAGALPPCADRLTETQQGRCSGCGSEMQGARAEDSDQSDDDQIDRDDVIQQSRHDQDQHAGNQRNQWPDTQIQMHDDVVL